MMQEQEKLTAEQGGVQEKPSEERLNPEEKKVAEESEEARIFTQRDVNQIVQQRLAGEKARNAALLAQKEQELKARELGYRARDTLSARGLPAELMQVLDYTDEEAFAASLDRLEEVMNQWLQQGIDTRLKGRTLPRDGSGNAGAHVREAFGLK